MSCVDQRASITLARDTCIGVSLSLSLPKRKNLISVSGSNEVTMSHHTQESHH